MFCLLAGVRQSDLPAVSFLQPGSLGSTLDLLADAKARQETTIQRRSGDALEFYVNAILLIRKNCDLAPDGPLFPETHSSGTETNKCGFWLAPLELLEKTAHQLLDARLGENSREMDIIVGEMELLRQYDDQGDVDAFLHMLLRHWATAVEDRVEKAAEAVKPPQPKEEDDSEVPQSVGAAEALRSTEGFARTRVILGVAEDSEDALAVERQRFANARAYGQALIAIEGGGAVKEKLSEEAACAAAFERTARGDMSGAWVRQRSAPRVNSCSSTRARCYAAITSVGRLPAGHGGLPG